ncbi:MAG: serine hydrolase [Rhodospirillaceae bacterium]|nr:serine hydrolase [Rhodospirillaceae bacterium]
MPILSGLTKLRHVAPVLVLVLAAPLAQAEEYPVGTVDSMWSDPYMIGSYRHWDDIYPVRNIPRSGDVSELARGTSIENLTYVRGTTERNIDEYFELSRAAGLIVLKDDEVLFERYALGADETSMFTSMSMAKSIASTLVGFTVEDGLIESIDDPIDKYIPELAGTGYEGVPIKAILQMSSGIAFIEDYTASVSDSTRLWLETVHYRKTPLNSFVTQMERRQDPFVDFNYKGVDTAALGWLITAVTGQSLSAYAAEKLWGPLGMEADANWGVDGRGDGATEIAFCCFQATLRDFARFGQFMLHRGTWNGTELLSSDWIDTATTVDGDQVDYGVLYPGYPLGYGYQWWLMPGEDGAYLAIGVNGQFIYVNPAKDMVVAATHVWGSFWDDSLEKEFYALIDGFIAATD